MADANYCLVNLVYLVIISIPIRALRVIRWRFIIIRCF